MIRVVALYPNDENVRFDMDYYVKSHMPMMLRLMKPHGCIRYEIDRGVSGGAGGKPAYVAIGYIFFESLEQLWKGLQKNGAALVEDIPKYSSVSPTIQVSEVL